MSVVIKDFRSPWIQKFVTYSLFKLKSPELKALACVNSIILGSWGSRGF